MISERSRGTVSDWLFDFEINCIPMQHCIFFFLKAFLQV